MQSITITIEKTLINRFFFQTKARGTLNLVNYDDDQNWDEHLWIRVNQLFGVACFHNRYLFRVTFLLPCILSIKLFKCHLHVFIYDTSTKSSQTFILILWSDIVFIFKVGFDYQFLIKFYKFPWAAVKCVK